MQDLKILYLRLLMKILWVNNDLNYYHITVLSLKGT